MPSSVTHTYFACYVYQNINNKSKQKIKNKLEYFKLFSQGSDPFMFYHFLIGKKGKELQYQMHTQDTRKFFYHIIDYIKKNHLENNPEVLSYLYGYICHYYLDLTTHPYINYQAGLFDKKDKSTYSSNTLHQKIEYRIDSYFIQEKLKQNPLTFKPHKYIFKVKSFSKELKDTINFSIEKTYHIKNSSKLYEKSIWYMQQFFKIINYDPSGYKQKIYKTIDKLSPKWTTRLEELSYHTNDIGLEYLNLEHQEWCYPWDNSKHFTTSFLDLFEEAANKATSTINEVTDLLEEKEISKNKFNKIFKDLSYVTGLPCKEKVTYRYFKKRTRKK